MSLLPYFYFFLLSFVLIHTFSFLLCFTRNPHRRNLASVYSLVGKKTVLVGFDLRKPKIHADFGISNDHVVSTWLIGKDGLQDVIKETPYENLFIIPAGPVPPNPYELIALEKIEELLRLLKERYERIIIDSSPIGIVSDTFHLATLADTSILIVRQNVTLKDLLENTLKELKISDIKSLSLVINDLGTEYKSYGYGGKYGYNYCKVSSKKEAVESSKVSKLSKHNLGTLKLLT